MAQSDFFKDVKRRVLSEGTFSNWKHPPMTEARRRARQDAQHRLEAATRSLERARLMLQRDNQEDAVIDQTTLVVEQISAAVAILTDGIK